MEPRNLHTKSLSAFVEGKEKGLNYGRRATIKADLNFSSPSLFSYNLHRYVRFFPFPFIIFFGQTDISAKLKREYYPPVSTGPILKQAPMFQKQTIFSFMSCEYIRN